MGSPFSGVFTFINLQFRESAPFKHIIPNTVCYFRYIDDIRLIYPQDLDLRSITERLFISLSLSHTHTHTHSLSLSLSLSLYIYIYIYIYACVYNYNERKRYIIEISFSWAVYLKY